MGKVLKEVLARGYSEHLVAFFSKFEVRDGAKIALIMELCQTCLTSAEYRRTIIAQIAAGLRHLREVKIVHRDIKPDNVLFRDVPSCKVAIADYGLAQVVQHTIKTKGVFTNPGNRTLYYLHGP